MSGDASSSNGTEAGFADSGQIRAREHSVGKYGSLCLSSLDLGLAIEYRLGASTASGSCAPLDTDGYKCDKSVQKRRLA